MEVFDSTKSKQQICEEIPNHDDNDDEELGEIEVFFEFADQYPQKEGAEGKSDEGDGEETEVFEGDFGVGAVEGPNAVEEIVGGGGKGEATGVGDVFLYLKVFFADVGDAKVNNHARTADDSELKELEQEGFGEVLKHEAGGLLMV